VLHPPLAVEVFDRPPRVLGDRPSPLVWAQPRVVVDGVVGEVRRDQLDVAAVQGLVVGADVVEIGDPPILSDS
jgi:hypothetical protein